MKKVFLYFLTLSMVLFGYAQEKDKVKKTFTIPQKVYNTVSKHKRYKGYKVKHKHNGVTQKHKVYYKDGHVKNKTK